MMNSVDSSQIISSLLNCINVMFVFLLLIVVFVVSLLDSLVGRR